MVQGKPRGPEPTGRNEIKTADPILRKLFVIAHQRGVSIMELSRRIDRSDVCISNWKRGKHTPTMLDVVILAEALGCRIVVEEGA